MNLIKDVAKKYGNLAETPKIVWFRAVLQSLDVELGQSGGIKISVGQALERFLFTEADIISRQRLDKEISQLNSRLKKVKLDVKRIKSDSEIYSKLFLRYASAVSLQPKAKTRRYYTKQLSNFFSKSYSKEKNKQFFQNILVSLTPEQIQILLFAFRYLGEERYRHNNARTLREQIAVKFSKIGLNKGLVYGLIKDLSSKGLFNETQSSVVGGDTHYLYLSDLGRELLSQILD